ncbi:carboxylesterase family protein [Butyrivibrio sp. XPD2002]|uniref:carboxylesterase family protein n=1 Tax=Butyrivibrio sp. XPD2002 TaxID=1280665 RepID=UPI000416D6A0|nr:carboxylesterase family protein [Butyrivibrio sp. XPD2002]
MLRQTKVENGEVRGLPGSDPRITVYKGIPFAAPPVGKNRWRAPQPCENWDGVLEAYEFGPISVQDTPGLGTDIYCKEWHVDPEIPMDEDCLYLNVWTPAKKTDEKLPVLVWYFGGGFQWGYTAEMEFDGEKLARRGIVVVSVNYRLNHLGFLAHPEITKEAPQAPGNFGLLDQKAGLEWVYRNIAAFGGNPDQITISGQSAGGGSTMHQLACDDNFDKIKGAVVISGMIHNPKMTEDIFRPLNLTEAEKLGEEFFEFIGVKSLEEARSIDVFTLREKYGEFAQNHRRMFPFQDGVFCKEDPAVKFLEGRNAPVPVISGNTSDEFQIDGESSVESSVKTVFLDAEKNGRNQNHYYYRFDPDIPGEDTPGTFHSVDLWFFFETLGKCWRPMEGRHFKLARQMCDMFANFIKTGDPNGKGWDGEDLPVWEPYTDKNRAEMVFDGRGAVPQKEGGIRLGITGKKQALNPYLPSWEYIPDGEPYVFGDRVYVYGSHDLYNGETFCLGDYVCWSAPLNSLGDWHYEGVIYPKTADPLNKDGHMCLYAPDVTVGPDGRYYLYYVLDKISIVSVAVCDTPAGRYEFLGYVHYPDGTKLGEKEGDEPQFDPGVLTEGDKTYLFTGFCGQGDTSRHGAMLTVLGPDMLTVEKAPVIVAPGSCYSKGTEYEGHAFFEAPSIRKKDGKYFFIYSSEVMHELCYATSDSPEGPFSYGGVIVSNCDLHIDSYKDASMSMACGANNHGSMVQIGDSWYIFYHRHTNNTWYSRQGCAEKLEFRPDGSIIQAEITSCGLNNGPLTDIGEYPSYIACNLFTEAHEIYVGKEGPRVVQDGGDGDREIGYIRQLGNNSTAGYKYFDMKAVSGLKIKTRGYFNGKVQVKTKWDGEVLGEIDVNSQNIWTEGTCSFAPISGVNALYLTFVGSGSCSLKSFEFIH